MRSIYFISPEPTLDLLEKVQAAESQHQIHICTVNGIIPPKPFSQFQILQPFDSLEWWNVIKALPFFISRSPAIFHFYLSSEVRPLIFLSEVLKSLPGNQVIIEKGFSALQLPIKSEGQACCYIPALFSDLPPLTLQYLMTLTEKTTLPLLINGWGQTPIFKRHQIRQKVESLGQSLLTTPKGESPAVLLLAGLNKLPLREIDLLKLAVGKTQIYVDEDQFKELKGPWEPGENLWVLDKNNAAQDLSQILETGQQLKFSKIEDLQKFLKEMENSYVRLLSRSPLP